MEEKMSVKSINLLLNSTKTRTEGLKLLQSYLSQYSAEHFIENCTTWMHSCCKLDGFTQNNDIAIQVLNELITISHNFPQLNKTVSFFITNRFFDCFFKYYIKCQGGWSCLRTCFLLYNGPCGPFKETIEEHLTALLRKHEKISSTVAQCFSLVPSLGGGGNGGVIYQTNWKIQFEKFVNLCHSILNDLFVDVEEFQEYNAGGEIYNKSNDYSLDYLITQLHNHCNVLYFMLINTYPVPKYVSPDLVLQLICRALGINSKTVQCFQTTNNIALQKLLPEVHIILYSLLNALITTCKNQLLPYSHLICKLIKQTLEFVQSDYFFESEKSYTNLKISAYESLCNWLSATKNGSFVETISKIIVSNAVNDIESRKEVTLLKVKKPRNQSERAVSRTNHFISRELCCTALKTLQFLLKFSGISLKVEEHKFLQECVIKLLIDIQNNLSNDTGIYSVSMCRKELYILLLELINQPCPNWPPPTHFALRIFSRGENDACPEVSQFCSASLNQLTNIIHPQFSSVGFLASAELPCNKNQNKLPEVTNQPMVEKVSKEIEEDFESGHKNLEKECKKSNEENVTQAVESSGVVLEASTCNVSEESDISSHEDSVKTVQFSKNVGEFAENGSNALEEREEFNFGGETFEHNGNEAEDEAINKKRTSDEKLNTNESAVVVEKMRSPLHNEGESSEMPLLKKNEKPFEATIEIKTPQKETCKTQQDQHICLEGNLSEDSISMKSISPELLTEEEKPTGLKRRYFLRSKACKTSLEESEDINSSDSPLTIVSNRNSIKSTPRTDILKKRPRTRASSKFGAVESENESVSPNKDEHDAFEDIIEAFDDSFVA